MTLEIRRIRVVPKRYTYTDEVEAIAREQINLDPAKVHLYLSKRFGESDKRELFGFYLNYRDIVFDISSDGTKTRIGAFVAPRYRQSAERRRIKVRNIIARQMNLDGKVYMENGKLPEDLYFLVKQKNDILYKRALEKMGDTDETRRKLTEISDGAVGERLSDGVMRYCPEIEEVATELFEDFHNTDINGFRL